jgi:hypothetical protein
MVIKAKDVISKGRLEFDAGATDLAQSFMSIKKTLTASGQHVTYKADRNEEPATRIWRGRVCMRLIMSR